MSILFSAGHFLCTALALNHGRLQITVPAKMARHSTTKRTESRSASRVAGVNLRYDQRVNLLSYIGGAYRMKLFSSFAKGKLWETTGRKAHGATALILAMPAGLPKD